MGVKMKLVLVLWAFLLCANAGLLFLVTRPTSGALFKPASSRWQFVQARRKVRVGVGVGVRVGVEVGVGVGVGVVKELEAVWRWMNHSKSTASSDDGAATGCTGSEKRLGNDT